MRFANRIRARMARPASLANDRALTGPNTQSHPRYVAAPGSSTVSTLPNATRFERFPFPPIEAEYAICLHQHKRTLEVRKSCAIGLA